MHLSQDRVMFSKSMSHARLKSNRSSKKYIQSHSNRHMGSEVCPCLGNCLLTVAIMTPVSLC